MDAGPYRDIDGEALDRVRWELRVKGVEDIKLTFEERGTGRRIEALIMPADPACAAEFYGQIVWPLAREAMEHGAAMLPIYPDQTEIGG